MEQQSFSSLFKDYNLDENLLDEVFKKDGAISEEYDKLYSRFQNLDYRNFANMFDEVKNSFFNQGITFSVYSESKGADEQIFPFDLFPRVIANKEWNHIEQGTLQRNKAVNLFLHDLYHDQKILKQGVVPSDLIFSSANYLKEMQGFTPPGEIYTHICGTDLIKHSDGEYYVLEDNLRCPSGVSYVLSNRLALKKTLSNIFGDLKVKSVYEYSEELLEVLKSVCPDNVDDPTCVIITPGMYNSAYYEHSFLAQSMGVELVEGRDLYVDNNFVYMKTLRGPIKVDVIYRRIDDAFLDPLYFRKDSLLGVKGLMDAYKAGNVTLVNAPGTGVADDKAVYSYMPEIIKYYLDEEPILNNVRTYKCKNEDDFKYVYDNVDKLVIKPVDESGGYGISIGNRLTKEEIKTVQAQLKENPRKYIAQPIMSLSVHPTFIEDSLNFEARHVDLRTFCLLGKDREYVLKGGLTRVALKKGNLIVNSSQGGGSKDTWVLDK